VAVAQIVLPIAAIEPTHLPGKRPAGALPDLRILDVRLDCLGPVVPPGLPLILPAYPCIIVVLYVHHIAQPDLLDVAQTAGLPCLLSCACEHREQYCREDRDNRDDYQQFDQRKTFSSRHPYNSSLL